MDIEKSMEKFYRQSTRDMARFADAFANKTDGAVLLRSNCFAVSRNLDAFNVLKSVWGNSRCGDIRPADRDAASRLEQALRIMPSSGKAGTIMPYEPDVSQRFYGIWRAKRHRDIHLVGMYLARNYEPAIFFLKGSWYYYFRRFGRPDPRYKDIGLYNFGTVSRELEIPRPSL